MKTIFTVLQDIEKLIYKVLMWIILIPKTIVRIIWEPKWAAKYIRSELREGGSQFDDYVSPVILLLIVALLPALGYNALPRFGVTLSSQAETNLTTNPSLFFDASADFISSATDLEYYVAWEIWKKNDRGEYEFEDSVYHRLPDDTTTSIVRVDNNTIRDRFLYTFTTGEYLVYASAGNADANREDIPTLETYEAYLNVVVLDDPEVQVKVTSDTGNTLNEKTSASSKNFLDRVKEEQTIFLALALMFPPLLFAFAFQMVKVKKIEKIGEDTLRESFYVQCYYFSPLSLAVWGTYYAYYFFTLNAYWYVKFNTALQILLLPLVWAALWFIRTEVKRLAWELQVSQTIPDEPEKKPAVKKAAPAPALESQPAAEKTEPESELEVVVSAKNTLTSSLIVLVCLAALVYGANLLVGFKIYMDGLRLFGIRVFPALTLLLILGFGVAWYKRRKEKEERFFGWNVAGLVILTFAFVLVMNRISGLTDLSTPALGAAEPLASIEWLPPATMVAQVQPTSVTLPSATLEIVMEPPADTEVPEVTATPALDVTPLPPTPTPAPTSTPEATLTPEPSRFFVEGFDSAEALSDWLNFMTFGDLRMVDQMVDPGKLSIRITPLEEKFAWYYLVNDNFSYADVRMEAVVVNQGNNANGVSLICRHTEAGWYEFLLSNNGTYAIMTVTSQGYTEIANGGSARIKTGRQTNVYTVSCSGNELSLSINGTEVRRITNNRFTEGRIGIAVSAMQRLPVSVDFDSLSVNAP